MTEIKITDLLCTLCCCISSITMFHFVFDYYRGEFRLSTKILIVFTALLLGGSLVYSYYDLFKGGVRFV